MNSTNILKLNELKRRNMVSLLRILLEKSPLSRVELAQLSGCDNTTVTRGIRELLKRGLVAIAGKLDVGHGRPREQLIVNPEGQTLIGLSLEPTELIGQITDFRGIPRRQERVRFSGQHTRKEYVDSLEELTRSLLAASGSRLAGIGVSTFGTSLDPEGAILHHTANFPELKNFDLRRFFQEKFQLSPVFADMMLCDMNDELNRHAEERSGITMLVHLGHGIGMSLAINGMIHFQRNQHGGELGHNICRPDGEICRCGRRGCLETYCAVDNFLRHLKERKGLAATPTLSEASALYQQEDDICTALVEELLVYLAIILANQINNLSPDYLIISGSLLAMGKRFCDDLKKRLFSLLFEYTSQALTLCFRDAADQCSSATGAALLARARLLESPALLDDLL